MTEADYNNLLYQYRSGNLIPVLGSDLFKIKTPQGTLLSLEEHFMLTLEKDGVGAEDEADNFNEFSFKHIDLENLVDFIYSEIDDKDRDTHLITQLAGLDGFKLFLTTGYDRTLEELLGDTVETHIWNHAVNTPVQLNLTNGKKKIVYLFGRIRKMDEPNNSISFNDVDRMESLYNLVLTNTKSNSRENYSLLEYLRGKTLLFIGNNFQDWFIRFAIRILCNAPYNNIKRRVYIIDDVNRKLNFEKFFFTRFEIKLIYDHPISEFINKLTNTIRDAEKERVAFDQNQVFISYDRDDTAGADTLYQMLRNNRINTWLDRPDLQAGDHKEEIDRQIVTTSVFITLLSKGLVEKPEAESYVKYHEWKTAEERFKANKYLERTRTAYKPFTILPIAIDDFNGYIDRLPEFIKANNIYSLTRPDLLQQIEQVLNQ